MTKTAITPIRTENYPEWYQQVIIAADLAENSPARGCMVIKPWGYAIWENLQRELDRRIKETGHVNAYFPLFIPLNLLEKEAAHIEGFSKECAVVTHHSLVSDGEGGLKPDNQLEEPLVIRPTSETIIGTSYSKWIQSYRDLPILINQWANVVRWEMRTRLFLRTTEFLWQEGHTAHATSEEAIKETLMILDLYEEFAKNILAIPVIKGEKPVWERFPGATNTYCIEAMMQDRKALQAGTSHFLGQNFAKAYDIKFLNQSGQLENAWTTSWGVSTRLIGGVIMTHSDDNGLVLPPTLAPQQIVIMPIYKTEAEQQQVMNYCENLQKSLIEKMFYKQPIRVHIDNCDMRGGDKKWQWIKKGVPICLEIGLRDIDKDTVCMSRRDMSPTDKFNILTNAFVANIIDTLNEIQTNLYSRADKYRTENSREINNYEDFKAFFNADEEDLTINGGFVKCYAIDDPAIDEYLKPLKVTARCIPLEQEGFEGKCIFTGQKTNKKIVFAKAY